MCTLIKQMTVFINIIIHIIAQSKWSLFVDVIDNTFGVNDFGKESNDKNPKFKVGDHVKISKC